MSTFRLLGPCLRGVLAAGFASALFAGAALAQEEGDKVVLVLNNGKRFTGTLVSRDDANVKIKMGGSEISLPASFVASVEKVDAEPAPAPAPAEKTPSPRSSETPAGGGSARASGGDGGSGDAGGAPRGAMFVLKDGTTIEGFVVSRSAGKILVVPGKPVEIDETDVEESYGDTEPAGGGGKAFVLSGDTGTDAARMVQEFASGDRNRMAAAKAVIVGMNKEATPALLAGLRNSSSPVRDFCLQRLYELQPPEAVEPVIAVLRADPDPAIRNSAAGKLGPWDPPGARRALLEAIWRDREDNVKTTGLIGLTRTAGPEEASALIDLLSILPTDAPGRKHLFNALRKATDERLADDAAIWNTWWDEGGRDRISRKAEILAERRRKKEEAARFGTPYVEEEAPASQQGAVPSGLLQGPPPMPAGAPGGPPPGGPPAPPPGDSPK